MQEQLNNFNSIQAIFLDIIPFLLRLFLVLLAIAGYWVLYGFASRLVNKYQQSENKKPLPPQAISTMRTLGMAIGFLITTVVIWAGFSNSLGLFFSSVSFLSAALVIALGDFVASFVAWLYIQFSDQYSKGDSILISSDTRVIYGKVLNLGIFRTVLLEKLGDGGLDTEMTTGRILSFPNRFVYKHSLTNYSKNHLLIQHKFALTLEYDQDFKKAREIIEEATEEVFSELQDNEKEFLDPSIDPETNYSPKVYMHLADSGVCYTVWFAAQLGKKRVVLEKYSEHILAKLTENNLILAFNTIKIVNN